MQQIKSRLCKLFEGKWSPDSVGLSDQEIDELQKVSPSPFPPALIALYQLANGAHFVSDFYLADSEDFVWFNQDEAWREEFPGAIFFVLDEGSGIYFIDTFNQLQHGAGCVYWSDRSWIAPDWCLLYGDSVEGFLENIFAEIDPRSWSHHDRRELRQKGFSKLNSNGDSIIHPALTDHNA